MMKQTTMMKHLESKGVDVCGTTGDFYGYKEGKGIWISAESNVDLFDYWSPSWADSFGVNPKLDAFVQKAGWYFEWNDCGTIMAYPAK
jgi:hypothetical protein